MISVGVIGFGTFGRFMCSYLKPFCNIGVYDQRPLAEEAGRFGVAFEPVERLAKRPVIIIAVPVQAQEDLLRQMAPVINPLALVVDVSSVKLKPVALMEKHLPATCQILATHPLFGPFSGKHGIAGLTVITWPVRVKPETYAKAKAFLVQTLKLVVKERSPEEHDRQMAHVLALTLFIGRALSQMQIPDSELKTATYQHLIDLENIVRADTPELFRSIQAENPFADEVRQRFLRQLQQIESEMRGEES
ncbi:prephenate dehydrogenase/arogenate dehydrogenase family protein [Candidatus Parcubacteria bacterium]|nr:prephenate dehydrogenase/arogenate dehydrogenase family protein [Candidatus Parcubacteria bacterium]